MKASAVNRPNALIVKRLYARRGMVLITVMIVVVMVSLAGYSFAALMFTEKKTVKLHGNALQLECATSSGEEWLKVFLSRPSDARREQGGVYDNPDMFGGLAMFPEESPSNQVRLSIVAPRREEGEVIGLRFGVEDESSKLNLAVLPLWEQRVPGSGKQALMHLPGMTDSLAEAMLDWIDADGEPRTLGAERDYYSGLDPAYGPRNGSPLTLEELLLVKGVTRSLLFGADANRNHHVDEREAGRAAEHEAEIVSLEDNSWSALLTVYSAEANVDPLGRPRINLNSPHLVQLEQGLRRMLDAQWASFIVAYRQFGQYHGNESAQVAASPVSDVSRPPKFTITSVLDLVDAKVAVPSSSEEGTTTIFASPLRPGRDAMRLELSRLLDYTTLTETPLMRGRVNVNQAPRTVLAAVPGMTETLVDQILSARTSPLAFNDPDRRHATWLLAEGLVDLERMKVLLPYLTGGGNVFRAQIVGFFDDMPQASRVEVVIDATSNPPRQLYREDLRHLGRGYSLSALGAQSEDNRSATIVRNLQPQRR
jgi:hypothetical protein